MNKKKDILFCCQTLDAADPAMSFFHEWIAYFAPAFDQVTVIALKVGEVNLPGNVKYISLGKEKYGGSRFRRVIYAVRLLHFSFKNRDRYDKVFVHMNQEFILVCGITWKILGKEIYLWYNHYAGSFLTDIAGVFCKKVFFTSHGSYTARFSNAVRMPVGIRIGRLDNELSSGRTRKNILFLARIAPSKRAVDLIRALGEKTLEEVSWQATIVGPTVTIADNQYLETCKKTVHDLNLERRITFHGGMPFSQTKRAYLENDIFVNCSQTGMYDKTIFEAAASGCVVLASSVDYKHEAGDAFYFEHENHRQLAERLKALLLASDSYWVNAIKHMHRIAAAHSIEHLKDRLVEEMYG